MPKTLGAGGVCWDARWVLVRMQEFRSDALGSHLNVLLSSDVMKDECKDNDAELAMTARPRSMCREESVA
jgi:hypothetical protein